MTESTYGRQPLAHTLSPSMDITVSSNFERLLFDLYDRKGTAIAELMNQLESHDVRFSDAAMAEARKLFSSHCVSDTQTCEQIASIWRESEYLLDPHSAIGVHAALSAGLASGVPVVSLATAHPAKFPEAMAAAGLNDAVALPPHLADLFDRPERFEVLPNDLAAVQAFMSANINA